MNADMIPYIMLFVAAAATAMGLFAISGVRRRGARFLPVNLFLIVFWLICMSVLYWKEDANTALLIYQLAYIPSVFIPVLFLYAILDYSAAPFSKSPMRIILLAPPTVSSVVMCTNSLHQLMFRNFSAELTRAFPAIVDVGPWFIAETVYDVSVVAICGLLLYRILSRAYRDNRRQAVWVIAGTLLCGGLLALGYGGFLFHGVNVTPVIALLFNFYFYIVLQDIMPGPLVSIARDRIFSDMSQMLIIQDEKDRVAEINPAMRRRLIDPKQDVSGLSLDELYRSVGDMVRLAPESEEAAERIIIGEGAAARIYAISRSYIDQYENEPVGSVLFLDDITAMDKRLRFLERETFLDGMTGIHNRKYYDLKRKRLDTQTMLPIAILSGDLNGLKKINDTYGHEMGDRVIKETAWILKRCCDVPHAVVCRMGGDEFAVMLPHTSEREAEEIIRRVEHEMAYSRLCDVAYSISFGLAVKTRKGQDIRDIAKQADRYLYMKKLTEGRSYGNYVITSLLNILRDKTSETEKHCLRIQAMCEALGARLGYSHQQIEDMKLLALLHDIGKIGIPDHILEKEGGLSREEYEVVKEHSAIGYRIISIFPNFQSIAQGVLHHHEHWDGTGYPTGLEGEDIPLQSRVIAVLDAYDVMRHDERRYQRPMSTEEALKELSRCKGTQFDPALVDALTAFIMEEERITGTL